MPGKSKRKKYKYSSVKRTDSSKAFASKTPQVTATGTPAQSKNITAVNKQAVAQNIAGQFKYVGTELKVAGILSAIILIIIIALYLVLR